MGEQALTLPQAMELAAGLHKAGILQAAEEIYERVLAAAPEHADALHLLGLARYQQGRQADGVELLQRAVAVAPGHADARNNLGNMLLEQDRLVDAENAYRAVLELRPEHADAHVNLGIVLRRKGDAAGAEAAFRRAIALNPKHGVAHHNLGGVLRDAGKTEEALSVYQRALALNPYDGESFRRIGATLYALGRVSEAADTYRRWLALEPDSSQAKHYLAACTGEAVPARASDEFVQGTFDSFAGSFDTVLARLQYRAPALCAQAVEAALGPGAGALDVLDAGAGTGLCGPLLRPWARRLAGVDLSPKMLARARTRAVYDELDEGELVAYMRARPAAFDLVVSADTLVYFGDLGEAAAAAAAALRPGGHLVFTVEHATEPPPAGFRLEPHGRYSHGEDYVRATLDAAGLAPVAVARAHLRLENKTPVEGLVVTARRSNRS